MLRTRVLTAVVVLVLVVGMLFFAPRGLWAAFALTIALVGCWEWSRMSGLTGTAQTAYLVASIAIGAFLWFSYMGYGTLDFPAAAMTGFIVALLLWVVVAPMWLARRDGDDTTTQQP
jgi:phosphatidate cytidylyltransferase